MTTLTAKPRTAAEFIEADFSHSAEQEALRARVKAAVEAGLAADAATWEKRAVLPGEALRSLATLGVLALPVGERDGGHGLGWTENAIVLRELAAASGSIALTVHLQNTLASTLAAAGGQAEVVNAIRQGEAVVALAHREEGGRTDLSPVHTTYRKTGEGFVLHGTKRAVLLGPHATHLLVTAVAEGVATPQRNGASGGNHASAAGGLAAFLVDVSAKGVEVSAARTRGLRAMGNASVVLNAVAVPATALLGTENDGQALLGRSFQAWRGLRVPFDIATAHAAVLTVVEDSKKKITFGKPLLKYQVVQFRLMDSQAKLELVEPLSHYLNWLADTKQDPATLPLSLDAYAALVHLLATRYARKAFEDAIEIGGGRMFNEDHPVWQRYMDSVVLRTLDGIESVDLDIVAHEYLGAPVVEGVER